MKPVVYRVQDRQINMKLSLYGLHILVYICQSQFQRLSNVKVIVVIIIYIQWCLVNLKMGVVATGQIRLFILCVPFLDQLQTYVIMNVDARKSCLNTVTLMILTQFSGHHKTYMFARWKIICHLNINGDWDLSWTALLQYLLHPDNVLILLVIMMTVLYYSIWKNMQKLSLLFFKLHLNACEKRYNFIFICKTNIIM